MIVALSSSTNEAALSGSPGEYLALASVLEQGQGTLDLDTSADVQPYDTALESIVVSEQPDASGVSIAVNGKTLTIQGPRARLSVLADIVRDSAHAGDPDGHVHIEYYPDHDYLSENSLSLTIADARP